MKKNIRERIFDLANWFQLNIAIAFMPFITVHLVDCIMGYNIGLKDILSDYVGICYSTAVILIVCFNDYYKKNKCPLIAFQLGFTYGMVDLIFAMTMYIFINIYNKFGVYSEKIILRIFILLTMMLLLNISLIIIVKVKEFSLKDKEQ